jgi:hypothetical protein
VLVIRVPSGNLTDGHQSHTNPMFLHTPKPWRVLCIAFIARAARGVADWGGSGLHATLGCS